jgi:excisionase family DNA binding protein
VSSVQLLTVQDVARLLAVSPSTVRRLTQRGELESVRVGVSVRYRNTDIQAYLNRRTTGLEGIE